MCIDSGRATIQTLCSFVKIGFRTCGCDFYIFPICFFLFQPCISLFPIAQNAAEARSSAGVAHGGRRRSECFAHLHLKWQDTYTSTICTGLFNAFDRVREVLRNVPSRLLLAAVSSSRAEGNSIRAVLAIMSVKTALSTRITGDTRGLHHFFDIYPRVSHKGKISKADTDLSLKITHSHLSHSLDSWRTSVSWL